MASKFVPRQPQFGIMLNNPVGMVGRHMKIAARRVQYAAQRQVGVKTAKLMMSIKAVNHKRTPTGQSIQVGSDVSYALIHHEGSRPHVILPNRAPALVFPYRGRIIRTNRVNHPGTKPNRYLSDNLGYAIF